MRRTTPSRLAAAALAASLLFGACSSNDDKTATGGTATATQTSLSSSEQWAQTTCGAITTWQTNVLTILTGLRGSLRNTGTTTDAASKGDQLDAANKQLVETLKSAGLPKTEEGAQLQAQFDSLDKTLSDGRTQLDAAVTAIQNASGAAAVATAIGDAATTVGNILSDLDTTITAIKDLSPTGELKKAVEDAPACQTLKSGSERRSTEGTTGS